MILSTGRSDVKDRRKRGGRGHERGGRPWRDPEVFPKRNVQSVAHDQNFWRTYILLYIFRHFYGLKFRTKTHILIKLHFLL